MLFFNFRCEYIKTKQFVNSFFVISSSYYLLWRYCACFEMTLQKSVLFVHSRMVIEEQVVV